MALSPSPRSPSVKVPRGARRGGLPSSTGSSAWSIPEEKQRLIEEESLRREQEQCGFLMFLRVVSSRLPSSQLQRITLPELRRVFLEEDDHIFHSMAAAKNSSRCSTSAPGAPSTGGPEEVFELEL